MRKVLVIFGGAVAIGAVIAAALVLRHQSAAGDAGDDAVVAVADSLVYADSVALHADAAADTSHTSVELEADSMDVAPDSVNVHAAVAERDTGVPVVAHTTAASPAVTDGPPNGMGADRLVRILEAMKPAEAARILAELDDADAAALLASLPERKAALIMGGMNPTRAAAIWRIALRGERSEP